MPSAAFEEWASEEGINNFHFNHCWAAWQAALRVPTSEVQADHIADERKLVADKSPQFLFIAMDDEHLAHPVYCADRDAVTAATREAMFIPGELSLDHAEELEGVVDELLENGSMHFEGDPPLLLYRLPASSAGDQEAGS
ncbi:hypothetical protein [Paraburkholderia elongata]|uniref:Uncharacterized protein n=1 Tax=Paraburkholderia elongata TaxID=2675747 RepID=A0A972NV69_9BURK|nr:hypothetical protein [Paraburkholderia elongata]NPT59701.1 hypothetical protein [Paraburkholderia elongata]